MISYTSNLKPQTSNLKPLSSPNTTDGQGRGFRGRGRAVAQGARVDGDNKTGQGRSVPRACPAFALWVYWSRIFFSSFSMYERGRPLEMRLLMIPSLPMKIWVGMPDT